MSFCQFQMEDNHRADLRLQSHLVLADLAMSRTPSMCIQTQSGTFYESNLWSAKDSSFSALSVPAEANMMVVSRSAMIPDTALAAVMQA